MKNDGRFAGTRPAMMAFVERSEPVLWLQAHLDQPHVVLFAQTIERQHRPQNGCRFDTDQNRSVNALSDDGSVRRNNEEIHGMFVYLADQRWRSNGKDKRFWRHAFMGKMFQARTGLVERDFMGNGFQKFPDLFVGGSWNLLVLSLAQLFG